jgi:hypothetical protein
MKIFFSSIVAVAKAVPMIYDLINQFMAFWIDNAITKIEREKTKEQHQIEALLTAINKAETREEVIALSITLNDINNRIY